MPWIPFGQGPLILHLSTAIFSPGMPSAWRMPTTPPGRGTRDSRRECPPPLMTTSTSSHVRSSISPIADPSLLRTSQTGHMDYTLRPHADASITSVSQPRSNILKSIVSDFLEVLHAREIPVSLVAHPNLASRFVSPANRFLCYLSHVATALSCVTGVPIRISFGQYSAGWKSEVQGVSSNVIISETFEQCIRDNSSGADKGLRSLNSFRDAHSRKQVRGCICT